MYRKSAIIGVMTLCLLLYCSCLKREHSHPLDPLYDGKKPETDTPTETSTDTPTETPVADTFTFTLTPPPTDTPTQTDTPTETPTPAPMAWLDRGENFTDICEGMGGCHGGAPPTSQCGTGTNLNEAVATRALYPNVCTWTAMTMGLCTVTNCWAPGPITWSCNCAPPAPSSATCDISNYLMDAYAGTGSLRFSGAMKGYTWGGWAWQELVICQDWMQVDISGYTGITCWGKMMADGTGRIGIANTDFGGSFGMDFSFTGSWTENFYPFTSMDTGWPAYTGIPGPPSLTDGVEVAPNGNPYDFLVDELRFY